MRIPSGLPLRKWLSLGMVLNVISELDACIPNYPFRGRSPRLSMLRNVTNPLTGQKGLRRNEGFGVFSVT